MDNTFVFFVLLAAVILGYLAAVVQFKSKSIVFSRQDRLKEKLRLLFRLEDDREITRLVASLEVSKDTFSIHIAIGSHYRKKGEVEKAIGLHQNLLGHPELTHVMHGEILMELAKDYMVAGLLDRAESLLIKLVEQKEYRDLAIQKLMDIYLQEKEWGRAIQMASSIEVRSIQPHYPSLAHFCCEVAQEAVNKREFWEAKKEIKKALDYDRDCVRALFLLSDIHSEQGVSGEAVSVLKKIVEIDSSYCWDVGVRIKLNVEAGYSCKDAIKFVKKLYVDKPVLSLALILSDLLNRRGDLEEAIELLERQLVRQPSVIGLVKMLDVYQRASVDSKSVSGHESKVISSLVSVCDHLSRDMSAYKCTSCGFEAKRLYWLCPSCRKWSASRSVLDLQGSSSPYTAISQKMVS